MTTLRWFLVLAILPILTTTAAEPDAPTASANKEISCDLGHGVKMEFVLIRSGTFTMGSPGHDGAVHQVTLTKPYYIGKYEVTQTQWREVTGTNPSKFQEGADASQRPVESISWTDIHEQFLPKLAERLPKGLIPRLPTEAEWEYACRAGTTTTYCFGDSESELADYAWYADNAAQTTHPVGQKKPNAWGLYDMHGNVWEWVADWKEPYPAIAVTDPTGPTTGDNRANRGGTFHLAAVYCQSSRRSLNEPRVTRGAGIGFRLALSVMP